MPSRRRPSRACLTCRIRRIKCDLQKPSCSQCTKRCMRCPGYENESTNVTAPQSANDRPFLVSVEAKTTKTSAAAYLMVLPNIPLEDLTSCHFVANYVLVPQLNGMRGFLQFVAPFLNFKGSFPHFQYAFDACSIASLNSRVGHRDDLRNKALVKYTKALSATSKAIHNISMMKHDTTLAAVLLLGLFETITANSAGTMSWGSHIDGAIQLVKARDEQQLRTKSGLDLFIAARTQMIIHSLSTGKFPDTSFERLLKNTIKDEPTLHCQEFNIRTGKLKAEARSLMKMARTSENIESLKTLVEKCQSLDQEFLNWTKSLPEGFGWKTAAWEPRIRDGNYAEAEVYPGRIDAYQDVWAASVWNLMRCSRIVLTSIIVRCVSQICWPDDYRTTPEYATATKVWAEAISDIISSVPYLLGWFSKRKSLLKGDCLSGFGCGEDDAEKTLSGYFLVWPLRCIQAQAYLTDSQREWTRGRLQHIGAHLGIRTALMPQVSNIWSYVAYQSLPLRTSHAEISLVDFL